MSKASATSLAAASEGLEAQIEALLQARTGLQDSLVKVESLVAESAAGPDCDKEQILRAKAVAKRARDIVNSIGALQDNTMEAPAQLNSQRRGREPYALTRPKGFPPAHVVVCSTSEWSLDGINIMEELRKLVNTAPILSLSYSWAGAAAQFGDDFTQIQALSDAYVAARQSGSNDEASRFEALRDGLRGTQWWSSFVGQIMAGLRSEALAGHAVIAALIQGGPITEVEQAEMESIVESCVADLTSDKLQLDARVKIMTFPVLAGLDAFVKTEQLADNLFNRDDKDEIDSDEWREDLNELCKANVDLCIVLLEHFMKHADWQVRRGALSAIESCNARNPGAIDAIIPTLIGIMKSERKVTVLCCLCDALRSLGMSTTRDDVDDIFEALDYASELGNEDLRHEALMAQGMILEVRKESVT